jgi:hypothetical protein
MKSIILHVGSGKTGSTSIQRALYLGKKNNDVSIYYPLLLDAKHNQIFRFAFCDAENTPSNIKREFSGEKLKYQAYQNKIKKSFAEQVADKKDVVVSSEFLFLSSSEEVKEIKKYLTDLGFEKIHVVMYLRDPAKYYLSVAQQALKNQHVMPRPDNFRYDIEGAIDNWASIDPASLTVKEFDREKLYNQDIVHDFKKLLFSMGYDIDLKLNMAMNESMSVEGTMVLQEFHKVLENSALSKDEVSLYLQRARKYSRVASAGTKPTLKPEISKFIYNRYSGVIDNLQSNYNLFNDLQSHTNSTAIDPSCYTDFFNIVCSFDIEQYLKAKSNF